MALTACSGPNNALNDETEVPIVLHAAPLVSAEVTSRTGEGEGTGSITSWDNTDVDILMYTTSSSSATSESLRWKATIGQDATVSLNPPRLYYPGLTYYFRGYFPAKEPDTSTNIVSYDITSGQTDIMMSDQVSGSRDNPTLKSTSGHTYMTYQHLLTQLNFRVKNDGTFPATYKVKKIEIKNLRVKAKLDLNDSKTYANALSFSDAATSTVTAYSNAAGLAWTMASGGYVLSDVISTVMIEPKSTAMAISITVTDGTSDIVLSISASSSGLKDITGQAKPDTAYYVDLTFNSTTVTPIITLADWTNVDKGTWQNDTTHSNW